MGVRSVLHHQQNQDIKIFDQSDHCENLIQSEICE